VRKPAPSPDDPAFGICGASLEAEERLLSAMGWNAMDGDDLDGDELTADEIAAFKVLKANKPAGNDAGVAPVKAKVAIAGNWMKPKIPEETPNDLSSSDDESSSDDDT